MTVQVTSVTTSKLVDYYVGGNIGAEMFMRYIRKKYLDTVNVDVIYNPKNKLRYEL